MGFQTQVNVQPAPAVWGDFCDANPRFTVPAGAGAFVAGPNGLTIGRFCWTYPPVDPDGTYAIATNQGPGLLPGSEVTGFVHREQQGLITLYLADASMVLAAGFGATIFSGGDFWAKNEGTTEALIGQNAFALFSNGGVIFAAAGSNPSTAVVTGSIGSQTASFSGSISGDVLTVSAVTAGTIAVGSILSGGTGMLANTEVVSQLTGTIGGVGTYLLNYAEQTVAQAALTATYGLLNVTAVTSGALVVGALLTGSGVTAGTQITALDTGAGGLGTYYVTPGQTVGSVTLTAQLAVQTKWTAMSTGLPGELVKISTHPLG